MLGVPTCLGPGPTVCVQLSRVLENSHNWFPNRDDSLSLLRLLQITPWRILPQGGRSSNVSEPNVSRILQFNSARPPPSYQLPNSMNMFTLEPIVSSEKSKCVLFILLRPSPADLGPLSQLLIQYGRCAVHGDSWRIRTMSSWSSRRTHHPKTQRSGGGLSVSSSLHCAAPPTMHWRESPTVTLTPPE